MLCHSFCSLFTQFADIVVVMVMVICVWFWRFHPMFWLCNSYCLFMSRSFTNNLLFSWKQFANDRWHTLLVVWYNQIHSAGVIRWDYSIGKSSIPTESAFQNAVILLYTPLLYLNRCSATKCTISYNGSSFMELKQF